MDFVEHNVILVIVDRLTKYAHFFSLVHPYSAEDADAFFNRVHKLYRLPFTILLDRDKIFLSVFGKVCLKWWEQVC